MAGIALPPLSEVRLDHQEVDIGWNTRRRQVREAQTSASSGSSSTKVLRDIRSASFSCRISSSFSISEDFEVEDFDDSYVSSASDF